MANTVPKEEMREQKKPVGNEIRKVMRTNGQTDWVSVSNSLAHDKANRIKGFGGISRIITESEMAKEQLANSEKKFRQMIENISDVIMIISEHGKVQYVSPNILSIFHLLPERLIGQSCFDYIVPEDLSYAINNFDGLFRTAHSVKSLELRIKDGSNNMRHISMSAKNLLDDETVQGILLNMRDISDHVRQEEKIMYMNYHDALTSLYNRSFFEEEKRRLDTDRQLPLSIIMGDVNGLKIVNDTLGHAEGDRLLLAIADIFRRSCRKEDIVARIGGDEFSIFLPQTDSGVAKEICSRITAACNDFPPDERIGGIVPSIALGAATKTNNLQSLGTIQKVAEDLMYERKLLAHNSSRGSVLSSMQVAMFEHTQVMEEHSERMVTLSLHLGKELGLSDEQQIELDLLSRLHDIGKICIDDSILSKPGSLTDEEWQIVKQHPEVGYRIARSSGELARIAELILCHHERWDGKGYPRGISGNDIPILSRIISIIDAYDAMVQDRPYRQAMSRMAAIQEIENNAGAQFDPEISKVFVEKILNEKWRTD